MNMQALPELTLPQMLRERARQDAARVAIRQKDFVSAVCQMTCAPLPFWRLVWSRVTGKLLGAKS